MQSLKHPNIVEFKESFQDTDNLIIIMEYCEDGKPSKNNNFFIKLTHFS